MTTWRRKLFTGLTCITAKAHQEFADEHGGDAYKPYIGTRTTGGEMHHKRTRGILCVRVDTIKLKKPISIPQDIRMKKKRLLISIRSKETRKGVNIKNDNSKTEMIRNMEPSTNT